MSHADAKMIAHAIEVLSMVVGLVGLALVISLSRRGR